MPDRIKPTDPDYIPSFSFLKGAFGHNGSVAKELHKRSQPRKSTPAQLIGNLVEALLIGDKDNLGRDFIVIEEANRPDQNTGMTSNVNKEWKESFQVTGKEIVNLKKLKSGIEATDRVKAQCAPAKDLKDLELQKEVIGTLPVNGKPAKYRGFIDALDPMGYGVLPLVWDIKTCSSAGQSFKSQITKNYYHVQLAMYMHAVGAPMGYLLAIEVKAPHDWQIWTLDKDSEAYVRAIDIAIEWMESFVKWSEMGKPAIGPQFWGPTRPIELYNY